MKKYEIAREWLLSITPEDIARHCAGKPVVVRDLSYDPVFKMLSDNGRDERVEFGDIWHLPMYVAFERGESSLGVWELPKITRVEKCGSVMEANGLIDTVSRNSLRKLTNDRGSLIRFIFKNYPGFVCLKVSALDYISIRGVRSPEYYRKDRSVELFTLERKIRSLREEESRIRKELASLDESEKRIGRYEKERMCMFEGCDMFVYFGNVKEAVAKGSCDCYKAVSESGARGVLLQTAPEGLPGISERFESVKKPDGLHDVWLVTGDDRGRNGDGTHRVAGVVPVKNLSGQMRGVYTPGGSAVGSMEDILP